MPHRFDATLKDIIAQHAADFTAVFGLPRIEPANTLNVDLSTISAATDVVFGFGNPLQEIVDLNLQSGPFDALPSRLHLYSAALHFRHAVPVRTVLLLLRPKADAANLTGKLAYGSDDDGVQFNYKVIRMWKQPVAAFLQGGLGLLPLATLCQMPADKALTDALREVVREIDRRLGNETSHAEAVRLMNASFILTGLRVRKDEAEAVYQGVQNMSELTMYDEMIEEIDKGIAKGIAKGRIEGELLGRIRQLLRLGRNKFGNPADAATEAALTAIQDLDRLDRLADGVFTATSWQELLATR